MRVALKNLNLAALSRTTAWRARKRGWACPGCHTPEFCPEPLNFERFDLGDEARVTARAYDAAAQIKYGPGARVNFPEEYELDRD